MYGTFVKYTFQHTYDAILAAPVDTEELVTGEALWIAARTGVYGCVPMLVGIVFGLDPSWGMLLVPPIAALAGYGWGVLRDLHRGQVEQDRELRLLAERAADADVPRRGHVLPAHQAPEWAQVLGNINPLYHCVELVRSAVFGTWGLVDLWHLGFLVGFALISWRLAIRFMERKLIL
jgi:hypothetical protein